MKVIHTYVDKQNLIWKELFYTQYLSAILAKKKGFKFYLSNNIKMAIKLNLDGAYIPSFNKSSKHLAFSLKKNFCIIGSAHNLKEIRIKENQKVDEKGQDYIIVKTGGIDYD